MAKSHIFNLVKAFITRDTAEKTAILIERKANAAIVLEIAKLEAEKLSLEGIRDACIDKVNNALINNGDSDSFETKNYLRNLIEAQNKLIDANEELEDNSELLSFWKEKLALINKQE